MAQSDDPSYGGLNVKSGIENIPPLIKRSTNDDDEWEDAKEVGQIACAIAAASEQMISRAKDFKETHNGEHWVTIWCRENPEAKAALNERRSLEQDLTRFYPDMNTLGYAILVNPVFPGVGSRGYPH